MEAEKRMTTRYRVKVFCREFAIYYRLAITTNNITKLLSNNLNKCRLKRVKLVPDYIEYHQ